MVDRGKNWRKQHCKKTHHNARVFWRIVRALLWGYFDPFFALC